MIHAHSFAQRKTFGRRSPFRSVRAPQLRHLTASTGRWIHPPAPHEGTLLVGCWAFFTKKFLFCFICKKWWECHELQKGWGDGPVASIRSWWNVTEGPKMKSIMELFFRFIAVLFWIWKATVLGLSFILDKAILMAVSWWNLPNKLRWLRFDDAQKKRRRPASQSLPLRMEPTKSGEIDLQKWCEKKNTTNRVALTWWMMFTRAAKRVILPSSCFSPRLNWGQGASLIRFEFPQELH